MKIPNPMNINDALIELGKELNGNYYLYYGEDKHFYTLHILNKSTNKQKIYILTKRVLRDCEICKKRLHKIANDVILGEFYERTRN